MVDQFMNEPCLMSSWSPDNSWTALESGQLENWVAIPYGMAWDSDQ